MASDQKRMLWIGAVLASVFFFAIGMIIGHFAIDKIENKDGNSENFLAIKCSTTPYSEEEKTYKKDVLQESVSSTCYSYDCNTEDLPRTYLAYHLNGRNISIDGQLDDEAWKEVPWTEGFLDIRGPDYPTPYFDTRVKVRWDDNRLYVGARMEETDFWGTDNYTTDETHVWKENAFEVYAVPDGSMHNYKEMQISVRNVSWDLMLKKAYIDGGRSCPEETVAVSNWSSDMQKATYTDGTINDPNGKGSFWSAEWSFTFEALAMETDRQNGQAKPDDQEAWFFIFARPEYKHKIVDGKYTKDESAETDWWSWQPMYTVNLHLPSRFGLVQFKRNMQDKEFYYKKWHIYRALFEVFEAEHKYKSINGNFISELTKLDIAPKYLSSKCVDITITRVTGVEFNVNVRSKIDASVQMGHIRADRYVWFS